MQHIQINMVSGKQAPKYENRIELACDEVVITEQGTQAGLPIVDFKMRGPGGGEFLMVLSGRLVNAISAAVRGANTRNHGTEEP